MFGWLTSLFKSCTRRAGIASSTGVELDAIRVEDIFSQPLIERGECVWVDEGEIRSRQMDGYAYYVHPERGGWCFRVIAFEPRAVLEFLMVPPARRNDV